MQNLPNQIAASAQIELRADSHLEIIPANTDTSLSSSSQQFDSIWHDLKGQLAKRSIETYTYDKNHFASWLTEHNIGVMSITRSHMIEYRAHLATSYAKATAARMWAVAKRLLDEGVKAGILSHNPTEAIKGLPPGNDETPHIALKGKEARELLSAIDVSTGLGKRDYALLLLMMRTGLRLSEVTALTLGDLSQEQGHHIITVRHGKGNKRRQAKVPVDVMRAINAYLEAIGRREIGTDVPLFVSFRRGDHPAKTAMAPRTVQDMVENRSRAIGYDLTPHCLRATFITLALEGGAKLQQVQYAAGHSDPRTTERYQKRKLNLDDNGVDYIKF